MVRANLQSVTVRRLYVLLEAAVYSVAAFRGFDVHECHLGVVADCLPEHVSLIVTEVYAMDVRASVLTFHQRVLRKKRRGQQHAK